MVTRRAGVCVVGGGPAGLLLGLLLAKRGVEVIVLEAHETFDREFRGEVLQPSTAHLLDELGLLEYILEQPHSTLTKGIIRVAGKTAGEFSFTTIVPEYPYAIWMPQPIFLQALVRKAEPFASFQCWMGARVAGLIEEDRKVVGVSGLRHGREPFEVRADVVVGADGRFSQVRRLGHFAVEYEDYDFDIIWFVIEQPKDWPNTIYVSLGQEVQCLMLPKYPEQIQAGLLLPKDEWRRWRSDGVVAVAERVRRLDPVFAGFA
ncbi:MAG: FAD-dependent monooxygenase, partial [Candidatus Methylomirabilaceae bacterium]